MVSERLALGRWTWVSPPNDATQDHSSSDPVATRAAVRIPYTYTHELDKFSLLRNIII